MEKWCIPRDVNELHTMFKRVKEEYFSRNDKNDNKGGE